ncbi:GDSL esterase/lipase At1g28600 isoform X2 [Cryptomeria japonica]|uniref:GDSL esterase/lipase At1g28600 isoform X2 n=1 Tax=Cryptomeria japonica TaxID=3369 RepID=UPI0027DA93B2|nr:GDSL esterase/lipase At1g28600 isoform X2 [Cryptomeria japonica]
MINFFLTQKGKSSTRMKLQLQVFCLIFATIWVGCLCTVNAGKASNFISKEGCFTTLFQFGASLFDTGNAVIAFPRQAFQPTRLPYGSTFPGYPANRFSDGKLIIDYLADAFKLELLHPYLESVGSEATRKAVRDYRGGVCFSVAMATALSVEELNFTGIGSKKIALNPFTSGAQFEWFQYFRKRALESGNKSKGKLNSLLPSKEAMANALYLPGEFGVNDYRVGLLSGLSVAEIKKKLVPLVVLKIVTLIKKLHGTGAGNFLVIGVPPQGCSPFYLTVLNGSKDEYKCLVEVNEIHRLHETKLKIALRDLREQLRDSNILFADYYRAFMSVIRHPAKHVRNVACCGAGGEYNYNPAAVCGTSSSKRCSKPENYVYWDDFHPTDALNKIIAAKFASGKYVEPPNVSLGCS